MLRYRKWVVPIGLAAALLLAAAAPAVVYAQGAQPLKLRLDITDVGVNAEEGSEAVSFVGGDQFQYVVEVEQGTLVELTFTWDHQGYVQDEHIMLLEGYNLEWDKITSQSREATLKFVADKTGSFNVKCDLECEVHDYLQRGELKVGQGSGGGAAAAAAYTSTSLAVSPSSWVSAGDAILLTAVLTDADGAPVRKGTVDFYMDAEFGGAEGQMLIGTARTDDNGVAFIDYRPTHVTRQHVITARFEGMGVYSESKQTIEVQEVGTPSSAYVMPAIGLERIRGWAPVALAGIMLSVWGLLAFVLSQALGIGRARRA